MNNDLYLEYQFTDRAGRKVYHAVTPGLTIVLAEVRLQHGKDSQGTDVWIHWSEDQCIDCD